MWERNTWSVPSQFRFLSQDIFDDIFPLWAFQDEEYEDEILVPSV